jgi:DNA polymerase-3 subunit alpha
MLRIHTHYANPNRWPLSVSTIRPEELAKNAKEKGYHTISLCDLNTVSGAVEFVKACKEEGITPILGCEFSIEGTPFTLSLFARHKQGWVSLLRLVSLANEKQKPSLTMDELTEYASEDDFVCVDGYTGSWLHYEIFQDARKSFLLDNYQEIAETCLDRYWLDIAVAHLSKMRKIFGDNYFLEVNKFYHDSYPLPQLISQCIQEVCGEFGYCQFIAGVESYYLNDSLTDAMDHNLILCTKLKCTQSNIDEQFDKNVNFPLKRFAYGKTYFLPSIEQLRQKYDKDEYNNLMKVPELCEGYEILSDPKLPHFACPDGQDEITTLKKLCIHGWHDKLKYSGKLTGKTEEYAQRLIHELEIIDEAGIAGYFLIVQDIIQEFRDRGMLIGVGRGSSAGSLVAYLCDITDVDPIEYNLLFSRFYNSSRKGSLPDIDTDFPPECREDVIQYMKDKYGHDKVCQVATYGRLQGRSALTEVLRVNEVCNYGDMKKITDSLPREDKISDQLADTGETSVINWALHHMADRIKDFAYFHTDEKGKPYGPLQGDYARAFEQAMRIEGIFKTIGKHAAGVIVCSDPVHTICPMIPQAHGEETIAGFDMGDLDAVGGVKLDILGLSLLSKIMDTVKEVNCDQISNHNKEKYE